MKRILICFLAIGISNMVMTGCMPIKKSLTSVKEHKTEILIIWLKPADLDPDKISKEETGKEYLVEANLTGGKSVLVYVNPKWAQKIMELKWPNATDGLYHGYAFTCDDLGRESIMTKTQLDAAIKSGKYNEQQQELLKRHWNERKYDLFSQLSQYTVKGRLDLQKKQFVPLMTKDGDLVYDNGQTTITNPITNPQQNPQGTGNPFIDGIGKQKEN